METDVAVVGGGPAGAAAAVTLARAGVAVTVLDKARFPRDKICGDGLTTGALRLLESLGLDPADVASWQINHAVVIRAPSGREHRCSLPSGAGTFAVAARRPDLDAAVLDLAVTAGADVRQGANVTSTHLEPGGAAVVVEVEGVGSIRARTVVAADGMWSPVRKHLGLSTDGYRGEAHAFRQYFHSVGPRAARELLVSFETDLLPAYFWSFPLPGGGANVGFGIHRGTGHRVREMAGLWPDLLARPHIREFLGDTARPEGPHKAWPIPARVGRVPLSGADGRVLFVGDAAAAADVMTGEGIGQALQTGIWAAEAILDRSSGTPSAVARRYVRAVEEGMVPDDRMSALLVRLLSHRRGTEAALRVAGSTPWTRRNFVRWMFEDEPRAALFTPSRWHRRFLLRPGAFGDADRTGSGTETSVQSVAGAGASLRSGGWPRAPRPTPRGSS